MPIGVTQGIDATAVLLPIKLLAFADLDHPLAATGLAPVVVPVHEVLIRRRGPMARAGQTSAVPVPRLRWYARVPFWWYLNFKLSRKDSRLEPLHPELAGTVRRIYRAPRVLVCQFPSAPLPHSTVAISTPFISTGVRAAQRRPLSIESSCIGPTASAITTSSTSPIFRA